MTILVAIGGAALIAVGSNIIVPISAAAGDVCDLAGIVTLLVSLGLLDGE
jgi:hypothetical protein